MPKGSQHILSCLRKKALLDSDQFSLDKCREYGRQLLTRNRWDDALEFFLKAGDTDSISDMVAIAREHGDAYLLERLLKVVPHDSPEAIWHQVGERARELGKYHFAHRAFIKADNEMMAAQLRTMLTPAPPPAAPPHHDQE